MKFEEGEVYKIDLGMFVKINGLDRGSCGYKVVEFGTRENGRLTGHKTLMLVTDDERERFVCFDGEEVEILCMTDWGEIELRTCGDLSDREEFAIDEEDASLLLM